MKKLFQKVKENMNLKVIIGFVILTVIFFIGKSVVYTNEIEPRMSDVYTEDAIAADKNKTLLPLCEGETIVQNFVYPNDQMMAVGLELYSDAYKNKGEFSLKIYDNTTNQLLAEGTFDASDLTDMRAEAIDDIAYFNVSIPNQIYGNENRYMRAEFTVNSLSAKSSVYLYANAEDGYEAAVITGAEGEMEEPASIVVRAYCYHYGYWITFYKIGALLIYIMLAGTYLAITLFRVKSQNLFLIAGVCMATCYSLLLLPGAVPDEPQHIATAYYYSNKLMGVEEPDDTSIYMRATDCEAMTQLQMVPGMKEYDYIMWHIFRSDDKPGIMQAYEATKGSDNWVLYIPTILGLTLGRLIGFNGITTIYLGRGFAVLCYLFFAYWALKRIPVGKAAMFVLVMSPMMVQQCCSYSYDALPIELSIVFVAELFSVLYEKRKIKRRDLIVMAVLAFFIASCKGGIYIPECLLFFLIPREKFESEKQCRRYKLIFVIVTLLGFLINAVPYLALVLGFTEATTELQQYSESLNCYTVKDVLLNPGNTIYVLVTTFLQYTDFYIETSVSGPLGWLNIAVSPAWAYSILLLAFFGIVCVKGEPEYITKKQRIWIGLALLVSLAMIVASMFVSWTPYGNTTVSGIQGRYFIPLLFYLFFVFRGKFVKIDHNIDNTIMFLDVALNVIIMSNILSSIQTVM